MKQKLTAHCCTSVSAQCSKSELAQSRTLLDRYLLRCQQATGAVAQEALRRLHLLAQRLRQVGPGQQRVCLPSAYDPKTKASSPMIVLTRTAPDLAAHAAGLSTTAGRLPAVRVMRPSLRLALTWIAAHAAGWVATALLLPAVLLDSSSSKRLPQLEGGGH